MVINVHYLAIGFAFFLFLMITYLTKNNKLKDKTSFLWLIISIVGLLVTFFLPFLDRLSFQMGIQHFPTFLFSLLFVFLLILLVYKSVAIHQLNTQIKELTQNTAIEFKKLEEELEQLKGVQTNDD